MSYLPGVEPDLRQKWPGHTQMRRESRVFLQDGQMRPGRRGEEEEERMNLYMNGFL